MWAVASLLIAFNNMDFHLHWFWSKGWKEVDHFIVAILKVGQIYGFAILELALSLTPPRVSIYSTA